MTSKKESKTIFRMKPKKILVICASGIGNTILFTPTLKALREKLPKAKIIFLVTKPGFAEPIGGSGVVDEVIVFNDGKGLLEKIKLIIKLRRKKFDYSITAFPSNRWQFNLFAFLIGAKKRVTHSYKVGKWQTLSFLQNIKIAADDNLHDVQQNLNLLEALKVALPEEKKLLFYLSEKERKSAEEFWKANNLSDSFVVGVHPGSGGIQQEAKRWPVEKFAELCNRLIKEKSAKILIFGGREEEEIKNKIKKLIVKNRAYIINTSLKNVAALIQRCNIFISNDSGLMQIAVAVGTKKVIGIFGPTTPIRTSPYGGRNQIITSGVSCSPCLRYPFHSTTGKIQCKRDFKCLKKIKIEDILKKLR